MARKTFVTKETLDDGIVTVSEKVKSDELAAELTTLVNEYANAKEIIDKYDKIAKDRNAKIKELMSKHKLESFDADEYVVDYSVSEKKSFDEDPMMEWMNRRKVVQWAIKTKHFIDTDILYEAIYQGKVSDTDLAKMKDFEIIKEIPTLRLKRRKKKGEK